MHVQTYKIDCQYCHADARRSEYAGLPSVTRCMGCHKITAADKPEIKKLAEYAAKNEPIPWVRVFKVPEFTYFPHKAHVRARWRCQTCHGPVETMTTVERRRTGPQLVERPPEPDRPPAGAAAAVDGLVHRLPPRAERDARHEGAARLRHLSPLTWGPRTCQAPERHGLSA